MSFLPQLLRLSPRLLGVVGFLMLCVLWAAVPANLTTGPAVAVQTSPKPVPKLTAVKAPPEVVYTGRNCLSEGSKVRTKDCPIFHFCTNPNRCVQWSSGGWEGGGLSRVPTNLPDTSCTLPQIQDGIPKGSWRPSPHTASSDPELGQTFHVPSCELHRFTQSQILQLLKGKRVLFSGDSMMRQMYIRLVSMLRGESIVMEHYYHTDSYYAVNHEQDVLLVTDGTPNPLPISDPVFEMYYVWDPFPAKYKKTYETIKPDIHFASFMYWWKGKDPFGQIDGYLEAMLKYASDRSTYQFFYMTTPWTAPGTFGGVEDSRRVPRNAYVVSLFDKIKAARALQNVHILDFSAYASVRVFNKTPDAIHYMCIWRPGYPKQGKRSEAKFKKNGCSDPVNENWVTVLLNAINAVAKT